MFSVDDLRFVVTLSGSVTLAAAARNMNVTPPAVTNAGRLLEERLGVRLVNRLGRRLALTDEGLLFVQHAATILDDMAHMTDALTARRHVVSGHLRILAPLGFGRRHVAPVVAAFRMQFPDLQIDLNLSDRPLQFRDDTWDVLIYIGGLPEFRAGQPHAGAERAVSLCRTRLHRAAWHTGTACRSRPAYLHRAEGKR